MTRPTYSRLRARFFAGALLLFTCCLGADATNLTGSFKNPDGSAVNGKLIFLLSQPARLNDQSAQIVPMVKIFSVQNGTLESGAFVYGNDVLIPGGTYYLVRLVDNNNNLLFEQKWSISGVNLDLGTLTPTTSGVVYPDPLIKNLTTDQNVQGPVSFTAPITAYSLTLNGNLNPGLPDVYELGNSAAPWQELHAIRWNSMFSVGPSGSTALPPNTAPSTSIVGTGGSISAGTYYFQITYFNKNGETTASPTLTVNIPTGTTNRIYVANGDNLWASGCYGYIVYASSDNVNFYAQTPSAVASDFLLTSTNGGAPSGKTGHYVALGDAGARFNSLTFSGAQPPSTNTATIDALQVALNSSMRQSDYAASQGELMVPVKFAGTAISGWTLTTPLIVIRNAHIIGTSDYGAGKINAGQTRIYGDWTQSKLGVVMTFGGSHTLENLGIFGPGNAVLMLGGVGYSSEAEIAKNSSFQTTDTTHSFYALKIVGVHYNIHHDNVYLRGDKAAMGVENAVGGEWSFENTRWDLGGPSAIKSVPSWTNPDDGTHNASFPFGVSNVWLKNILLEQGTGIIWDCVGLGVGFDNVVFADSDIVSGTDSIATFGTDSTYGGQTGLTLRDTSFGTCSTCRVGTNWTGGQGDIQIYGNSSIGFGTSSGAQLTLDLNNTAGIRIWDTRGGAGSFDPNAAATTPHPLNVHNNTWVYSVGDSGGGTNVIPWNEISGRLAVTDKNGNNPDRSGRWSLVNDATAGNNFQLRRGSDDAYLLDASQSNGFLNIRGNARVQATGGVAATLFIGPASGSAPTATGGAIATVNNQSWLMRNAANTTDVRVIAGDSSDRAIVGDAAGVCFSTSANCAPIKGNFSSTATLDFPSTAASACSDLTMTVTGAAAGDPVFLGAPNASVPAGGSFFAWVSATNTVTVRFCADGTTRDPASGVFRATVLKF